MLTENLGDRAWGSQNGVENRAIALDLNNFTNMDCFEYTCKN
jgi:hypothetical protein